MLVFGMPGGAAESASIWAAIPDAADVDGAYPQAARKAGLAGSATMICVVADDFGLRDCVIEREDAGGFGTAALSLAPKFRVNPVSANGASTAGLRIRAPLRFAPPEPRLREVSFPKAWKAYARFGQVGPYYPVAAGRRGGAVVIDCSVEANGRLRKCKVVEEAPRNMDFGAAALRMAQAGWIVAERGPDEPPDVEPRNGLFIVRFEVRD